MACPLANVCGLPIGQAAPYLVAAQKAYQSATAAHALSANGSYFGNFLTTAESGAIYGAPYRTPYSLQITGGPPARTHQGRGPDRQLHP